MALTNGDVGARPHRQVEGRLDVRRAHQVDPSRVGDDAPAAPARIRRFIRDANTGWASVGLAPMTSMTSACSTDAKSWVPAEVPNAWFNP